MRHTSFSLVVFAFGSMAGPALAAPETFHTISNSIVRSTVSDGGTFRTVSGDVRISAGNGALTVETVSGNVDIGTVTGDFTLRDTAGDATVQTIDGSADLRVDSADLTLGTVHGAVTGFTTSGDLSIAHLVGDLDARTMSGDIKVRLDWSGPVAHNVSAFSMSGDIVLHLPHDFAGMVDVETFQTRSHADEVSVTQNLGLPVTLGEWLPRHHSEETRKYTVRGVVGSGDDKHNVVKVRGFASRITILRD